MGVSYNRLWKMLIDKNMKRIEMQYLTGISGNILARMGKNQYVSMETIEKICKKLDCTVDEMLEFTDETSMYQWRRLRRSARSWTAPLMRCWNLQMMSNKSRHVKLLKLEECFRSRKKKLKKDNTPDTA